MKIYTLSPFLRATPATISMFVIAAAALSCISRGEQVQAQTSGNMSVAKSPTTQTAEIAAPNLKSISDELEDLRFDEMMNTQKNEIINGESFRKLLSTASILPTQVAKKRDWAYAPWYSGTFVYHRSTYTFRIFLGGRGSLANADGKNWLFTYNAIAPTFGHEKFATTQTLVLLNEVKEISIQTPNSWYLRVFPNGSANFGYGNGPSDLDVVPKGTFDFTAVFTEIMSKVDLQANNGNGCIVSFVGSQEKGTRSLGLGDARIVLSWFDTAHKIKRSAWSTVDRCWTAGPPALQPTTRP